MRLRRGRSDTVGDRADQVELLADKGKGSPLEMLVALMTSSGCRPDWRARSPKVAP